MSTKLSEFEADIAAFKTAKKEDKNKPFVVE
jgi:hypothetical protein